MKRLLGLLCVVCTLFSCESDANTNFEQSSIPKEVIVDNFRFEVVERQFVRLGSFAAIACVVITDKVTDVEYLIVTNSRGIAITPIILRSSVVDEE